MRKFTYIKQSKHFFSPSKINFLTLSLDDSLWRKEGRKERKKKTVLFAFKVYFPV